MILIVFIIVILHIITVENRMIQLQYDESVSESIENFDSKQESSSSETVYNDKRDKSYYAVETERTDKYLTNKPCSIVVLSNVQNHNMRSLLRKYRYNARGLLIPNSVRYFFKLPQTQTIHTKSVLIPLKDKAFSPYGGFVRYYKEVPPIPRTW